MAVRLEWEGKPKQVERISLPFQTVETINESRATRERDSGGLFASETDTTDARNQLIWGDNKLVMSSLLTEYAGQVKLSRRPAVRVPRYRRGSRSAFNALSDLRIRC